MNLLAEILSSNTRAEFFRLLFGTNKEEYYLREIERLSGMTIGAIQQEAAKLEKLGLIEKRRDGNRLYYKANDLHPLCNVIKQMVYRTNGLVDLIALSLNVKDIDYAFIFGSVASNTESPESDVDLFIVGNIGLRDISKLLKEASGKINREINPHVMTRDELMKRIKNNDHFISSVLNSKKIFIKGDENEFERLGGKRVDQAPSNE
ncbi:MAG: nucleotidyltransferase domain-containing protein [Fidelibacterota bacterium]